MNRIPSWAWSILIIVIILAGLAIGGGGPEGRAISRAVFPYAAVAVVICTAMSYWKEFSKPTRMYRLINMAAVLAAMYVTVPFWHFGVVLPETPGDPVTVRWWVNGIVLMLAATLYFALGRLTQGHAAK